MTRAWPAAVGVSLMLLLAPSPSAAQDDGGEWEGRIEYTKYIGISGHEGHRSERTASSGNGVRVVSSSPHDIDRDSKKKPASAFRLPRVRSLDRSAEASRYIW